MGFLTRHADLNAEVPPQSQPGFEENYCLITGLRPVLHSGGYYPIEIATTYDKWGPELRIYFPDSGYDLEFPPTVEVRPGNAPATLRINNNGYWWQLIRAGFRLGTSHSVQTIRSQVPPTYLPDFEAGYSS